MKTYSKAFSLKVLEFTSVPVRPNRGIAPTLSSVVSFLKTLGQSAIATLTAEPELRVWTKNDRLGHTFWYAYDPATGHSTKQDSEDEMRVWIEQRYYQ